MNLSDSISYDYYPNILHILMVTALRIIGMSLKWYATSQIPLT